MTLNEAMEVIVGMLVGTEMFEAEEDPQALKLALEACKRVKSNRDELPYDTTYLLPGETKD